MAVETKITIDELFASRGFNEHLAGWQRAKKAAEDGENELREYVSENNAENPIDVDNLVSYLLGMEPETFMHVYRDSADLSIFEHI